MNFEIVTSCLMYHISTGRSVINKNVLVKVYTTELQQNNLFDSMIWHVTDCISYDLEVGCFVGLFKRWICWSRTVVTWSNCHGEAVGILVNIFSKVIQNNSSPTWFCQKKPIQQWPVNRWYSLYMYEEYCSSTYIPPDFSKFCFHSFLWGFILAS